MNCLKSPCLLKCSICMLCAIMISLFTISCSDLPSAVFPEETTPPRHNTIIFKTRDDDYNVFEDSEYLEYDRQIYYTDGVGTTTVLDEESLKRATPAVNTLYCMIDAIIRGKDDKYNDLFSSVYYKDNAPVDAFRMQPLYDVRIVYIRTVEVEENGRSYTRYEYDVSYKICWNDGTFRTDLGHHESKKQCFVLSDRTGSEVLIDQIIEYKYKS